MSGTLLPLSSPQLLVLLIIIVVFILVPINRYGAVIRGDVNEITIGGRTSIQDGAVVTVASHNTLGFPAVSIEQRITLSFHWNRHNDVVPE